MPDAKLILEAVLAAGAIAAAILLICGWPWKAPRAARVATGSAYGVAIGFVVGCLILGLKPHWPPSEDVDRLLYGLLPAVVAVELISAIISRPRWAPWLLRGLVAIAAGRILLHGTVYIAELPGAARRWSIVETWVYLSGMGAALVTVWAGVMRLSKSASGRAVPLALALACGAAAVTVMLSGYATGGQMGFPLSAALAGSAAASLALSGSARLDGGLGVGVVGLFALVVLGRFFGELTPAHAAVLIVAPLGAWVAELPYLRRLKPWPRGLLQLLAVAVPLTIIVFQAQRQFAADSQNAKAADGSSLDDYMNYGK